MIGTKFIRACLKEYTKPYGTLIRNNISFAILMSIVPLIAILAIISLNVLKSTVWIYELLDGFVPADVIASLIDVALNTSNLGFYPFIFMMVLMYYNATRGFYTIILSFSYERHMTSTLRFKLQSLIAPIIFIILVIFVVCTVFGIHLLLPDIPFVLNYLLSLIIYLILSQIFFVTISTEKDRLRKTFKGALFFTFAMATLSNLFFFFINTFTHFNDIYGSLASLMIILLAIRIISAIIHMSHIINSISKKEIEAQP